MEFYRVLTLLHHAADDVPVLRTPRLVLRGYRLEDFEAVAGMWSDPKVIRFIGAGEPLSRYAAWVKLQRFAGTRPLLGYGFWVIQHATSGRIARLAAIIASLPPGARAAYAPMKKAFAAFVDARGGEVYVSGTTRAAMEIQEEDAVRDQFVKDLGRLASHRRPKSSSAAVDAADAAMNVSYREALSWAAGEDNFSTTRASHIHGAQRAWLVDRDAFGRFATIARPELIQSDVSSRLTKLGTAQLNAFTGDQKKDEVFSPIVGSHR